ncbi:hypothetical protein ABZ722_16450 [Streptomyces longwoodensis]|uniref:hypothetical protein n=1 Tax=Streptomyces longwoodensis TaxID=68231 RepID=UPI0033C4ACD2
MNAAAEPATWRSVLADFSRTLTERRRFSQSWTTAASTGSRAPLPPGPRMSAPSCTASVERLPGGGGPCVPRSTVEVQLTQLGDQMLQLLLGMLFVAVVCV